MPAFRRSQNGDYWIQRHLIRSELIQQNSKAAEKKERCPQGAFGGPSRVRTDDLRIKRHDVDARGVRSELQVIFRQNAG